tara:strand:- start:197 stop:808 length:612 start_codon:yes stop_codon:yes gene_type:complete
MFRYLPNLLSLLRLFLVLPISWSLLSNSVLLALSLFLVAGVTDALDGRLARKFRWETNLGSVIDPLADKVLVAGIVLVFTYQGHIPVWLAAIALGRDGLILIGTAVYRAILGPFEVQPSLVSKANTAVQIVTLVLLLLFIVIESQSFEFLNLGKQNKFTEVLASVLDPYVFGLSASLSICSGVHYLYIWLPRLLVATHAGNSK